MSTAEKFNKIFRHPDKDEIIKKLLAGESVKEIESWLAKKYSKRKRLQVSTITLQRFRREHLNLHGEVLEDIKNARFEKQSTSEAFSRKMDIINAPYYKEKIEEIANSELDTAKRLLEIDKLINARMIYYFNLLESGQGGIAEDKLFLEYMREFRTVVESWKKFVEGAPDQRIEHNININIVNEQLTVLKGIIFEILKEMSPALVPIFVEKLNSKLGIIDIDTEDYKRLGTSNANFFPTR